MYVSNNLKYIINYLQPSADWFTFLDVGIYILQQTFNCLQKIDLNA